MTPQLDGAALGKATLDDFRILCGVVARMAGGVWLNLGSAVVLPEVFLKTVAVARNLGRSLDGLTTANLDFDQKYRGLLNVLHRPGAEGIALTGPPRADDPPAPRRRGRGPERPILRADGCLKRKPPRKGDDHAGLARHGATGFLGRHVLAALGEWRTSGVEVVTLGRRCPPQGTFHTFLKADLDDPASVHRAIGVAAPAVVLHLAGQTPPASPEQFYRVNTLATVHLLDALRACGGAARVVLAGSAAELGPVELADLPVGEDHPCRPSESYGLSKLLATAAGLAARPPLEVIAARIFNPIGPGQPPSQALGRFAARLAEGHPMPLTVGDLDVRRDFIDARDVARALIALAEHGRAGWVYHVGTGQSRCVRRGARSPDPPERPRGRGEGRPVARPGMRAERLVRRHPADRRGHGLAAAGRVGAKPCGPVG